MTKKCIIIALLLCSQFFLRSSLNEQKEIEAVRIEIEKIKEFLLSMESNNDHETICDTLSDLLDEARNSNDSWIKSAFQKYTLIPSGSNCTIIQATQEIRNLIAYNTNSLATAYEALKRIKLSAN